MITKFKLFEEDKYEGVKKKFVIPKELRKNTRIPNRSLGLGAVRQWKTKVIVCNSCPEGVKVGDWDDVGYTMINYKTNEIIPIARADEHHTGYDLMWDYQEQGIIQNVDDWISIFWSNNFMFNEPDEKEAKKKAIAFEKWLDYGGVNTNLMIYLSYGYERRSTELDLKTYVDLKGNISDLKTFIEKEGQLTDEAKDFIENLGYIIGYFNRYHKGEESPKDLCDFVKRNLKLKGISTFFEMATNFKIKIERACNKFDVEEVEQLIFSHNGLKNSIHNRLRHDQDNPKLKKYFGNVKVALNKFDILSNI